VLKEEVFATGESAQTTCWVELGRAAGHNRRQALEVVLGGHEPANGDVYQVVPARSFKEIRVSVVTPKPEVKFEGLD
jgi:hypothetical protein